MSKLGSEQDRQTTEAYRKGGLRLATAGTRSPIVAPVTRFLLGLPVFILPTQTDEYFAWTIAVPMTAVFLGACYWSSVMLALIASRRPLWAQTRVSMAVALVFAPLVTAATFIHLDQFHTDKPIGIIWVIAYGIYPVMLTLVMRRQLREPGTDPPRSAPLASWVRGLLITEAVVLVPLGIAMFALPGEFAGEGSLSGLWPWGLTELTSQVCGAWVLALGVFAASIAWENDDNRVSPYLAAFGVLGLLQAIGLIREGDDLQWSEPAAYVFVGYLAATFILSAYGLLRSRQTPDPDPVGT